jgi:hypothetical protein
MRAKSFASYRGIAAALALAWLTACAGGAAREETGPRVPTTKVELASEAYVFAYPLVLFDRTRTVMVNAIGAHNRLVARTTTATPFTRDGAPPDADTVSAVAYLDLRAQPLVLTIADSGERFTRIELVDAYGNVFASLGTRTKGNAAASFAIVGPSGGAAVSGTTEVKAPTNLVLLQAQIATEGERDVGRASGLLRQWSLTPLSAWTQGKRNRAVERPRGMSQIEPPVKQVEALKPAALGELIVKLMQANPPEAADGPLVKKFPTIGLDWQRGSFTQKLDAATAERAWTDARNRIRAAQPTGRQVNGWTISMASGSFGVDYLSRAAAARVGLGGGMLAEDTIELRTRVDASGQPLSGAHGYEIDFAEAPPVRAFWSITLLDEQGRMVDNLINRYAVRGDRLRKGEPVRVQFAGPKGDRSGWLPAPRGPFSLVLRLYWPKEAAVSGAWQPPAVRRVD